jgi:hypothetical protein
MPSLSKMLETYFSAARSVIHQFVRDALVGRTGGHQFQNLALSPGSAGPADHRLGAS